MNVNILLTANGTINLTGGASVSINLALYTLKCHNSPAKTADFPLVRFIFKV